MYLKRVKYWNKQYPIEYLRNKRNVLIFDHSTVVIQIGQFMNHMICLDNLTRKDSMFWIIKLCLNKTN